MADAKGADVNALLKAFKKDKGESIGAFGGNMSDMERVPTGIFALDLALGGGFPRGRASMVYGPESAGKTNIVLRMIRMHQKLWPNLKNVFFAVEPFDPMWASKMGVDVDKLLVIRPSFAEEVTDMAESLIHAPDIGMIAIDSLGAMVTNREAGNSAEIMNVGGAGLAISSLARRTTVALTQAEKEGRKPTLMYINQIRNKIGVMRGDPEKTPGGFAVEHQINVKLRFYGKNLVDAAIKKDLPIRKEMSFIVKKHKVPILSLTGAFELVVHPHKGLAIGDTDDFNTICHYLEDLNLKSKGTIDVSTGEVLSKGGYTILGDHYEKLGDFEEKLYGDPVWGNEVREALIKRILKESDMIPADASTAVKTEAQEEA